jgi:hypothetical protein
MPSNKGSLRSTIAIKLSMAVAWPTIRSPSLLHKHLEFLHNLVFVCC